MLLLPKRTLGLLFPNKVSKKGSEGEDRQGLLGPGDGTRWDPAWPAGSSWKGRGYIPL